MIFLMGKDGFINFLFNEIAFILNKMVYLYHNLLKKK